MVVYLSYIHVKMRNANIARKVQEWLKRKRQREIIELKKIRDTKREIWEAITKDDYHPSGHIRHWK